MPALRAFAVTDQEAKQFFEAEQFFIAFRRRTGHHLHAVGHRHHSGLKVDPVGPDIDVASARQIALLPERVAVRPALMLSAMTNGHGLGASLPSSAPKPLSAELVVRRIQRGKTAEQSRAEPDPLGCRTRGLGREP
jgi:hypothetical protein